MLLEFRNLIRRRPRLRAALLPCWLRLRHLRWQARNALTLWRPVRYHARDVTAELYPEGQIPEALWDVNFEAQERDFVAAYLRSGMRVVNVGANVGLYTVLASALVGESGIVHAFEPSSLSYARLRRNLDLNECKNVIASRRAVADSDRPLVLRVDTRHPGYDGHCFVERVDGVPALLATDEIVQCCTLDEYLSDAGDTTFDFLIMDVEGAEYWVLRGAMRSLSHSNATIMLECSRNQYETQEVLRGLGYKFWSWDQATQALVPADFMVLARTGNVIARREPWRRPK